MFESAFPMGIGQDQQPAARDAGSLGRSKRKLANGAELYLEAQRSHVLMLLRNLVLVLAGRIGLVVWHAVRHVNPEFARQVAFRFGDSGGKSLVVVTEKIIVEHIPGKPTASRAYHASGG